MCNNKDKQCAITHLYSTVALFFTLYTWIYPSRMHISFIFVLFLLFLLIYSFHYNHYFSAYSWLWTGTAITHAISPWGSIVFLIQFIPVPKEMWVHTWQKISKTSEPKRTMSPFSTPSWLRFSRNAANRVKDSVDISKNQKSTVQLLLACLHNSGIIITFWTCVCISQQCWC